MLFLGMFRVVFRLLCKWLLDVSYSGRFVSCLIASHERMYDRRCDSLTERLSVASLCDPAFGGSSNVVISLSWGVMEAPTEDEI